MKSTVFLGVLMLVFASVGIAQSKEFANYDFEKGTKKWEGRGQGVQIRTTDKAAASGKKSLRVSGRKEFWQGAQLNLTNKLKRGRWYTFSASVKLDESPSSKLMKLTLQKGDNDFQSLAAVSVGSDRWTKVEGRFRPDGNSQYLLVFLESDDPRVSFFIDDFKITEELPKKQEGTLVKTDFQDGTAQGWLILGDGVKVFAASVSGNSYLKIDGRSKDWHGIARNVTTEIVKGTTYNFSVSVRVAKGSKAQTMRMVMRETRGSKQKFVEIARKSGVGDSEWVTFSGEYKSKKDNSDYLVMVQSDSETGAFSVDNFELKIP